MQLGGDRAGWYSWDHLDNAGVASAHDIHPEWQDRAIGDRLKVRMPGNRMVNSFEVAILEPNRFLGLYALSDLFQRILDPHQPRPKAYMEGLWCFQLKELPDGQTRLVVDGYQKMRPCWLERFHTYWVYVPTVWIMQARMLRVLKRNAERAVRV
jgi:proline iminopeptidase